MSYIANICSLEQKSSCITFLSNISTKLFLNKRGIEGAGGVKFILYVKFLPLEISFNKELVNSSPGLDNKEDPGETTLPEILEKNK